MKTKLKLLKQKIKGFELGILCGASHIEDVKLLQGMVNILKPELDKIRFMVIGFDDKCKTPYYDSKGNTQLEILYLRRKPLGRFRKDIEQIIILLFLQNTRIIFQKWYNNLILMKV